MCSIRLRKQKLSSKNAAQIGLTCADHTGHRQPRQLHSTSKAAEDRRTPRCKRRIKLAVTAIPRLGESAAVFCRFGSGQSFYGGDKVSAGYRRSAGVAIGAEPIKHSTLAVSCLRFRLRAPTERRTAIAASDMMKSTTMVISRKINIPYAIALKAEPIGI